MRFHPRRVQLCVHLAAAIFVAQVVPGANAQQQLVTNGTFEADLSGWQIRGAIAGSNGISVITDENATVSRLYQPVAAPKSGAFEIRFDFRNALSSSAPPGTFPDTFFATLYFTNNPATFDIGTGMFERAISLFDLDANGPFNVNGTLGVSSKGAGWSLFTRSFDNVHGFIVPAFELRDLNFVNNDSAVAIDNVVMIPEAQSWLLGGGGLAALAGRHRMRRLERKTRADL